jgi:hypothetical protein
MDEILRGACPELVEGLRMTNKLLAEVVGQPHEAYFINECSQITFYPFADEESYIDLILRKVW